MKTLKGWERSRLALNKYLIEPCEIDEELSLYLAECCAPNYLSTELMQGGNPDRYIGGSDDNPIGFYVTTSIINGKYFYIGILPEFRQ